MDAGLKWLCPASALLLFWCLIFCDNLSLHSLTCSTFLFCVSPMILQSPPDKVSKIRTRPTGDVWLMFSHLVAKSGPLIKGVWSTTTPTFSLSGRKAGMLLCLVGVWQLWQFWQLLRLSVGNLPTLPPLPPPPHPTDSNEAGLTRLYIFSLPQDRHIVI